MLGEKRTASVWLICMVLKTKMVEEQKLGSILDFIDFFFFHFYQIGLRFG